MVDDILNRRAEPQARSNLAERIIDASKQPTPLPKQDQAQKQSWLEVFFDSILLPQPALAALAVVLLLAGVWGGMDLIEDVDAYNALGNFSDVSFVEDNLDSGHWL